MEQALQFAILGLASGAIFAVLAQGTVLIYRGSGLLNFAHGGTAMVGAYVYYDLCVRRGLPLGTGAAAAVAVCALLGLLLHLGILAPMRRASALARVITTLGVVVVLQSVAFLRYGLYSLEVPSLLPTGTLYLWEGDRVPIGLDRILILVIGIVITVALTIVYRYTSAGRLTTAVAENQAVTASLGHSPDWIAACNWALGSAVAGLAGVLIAPITSIDPTGMILLVVPALSAALVGRFKSFPVTLVAALAIGVAQAEIGLYVSAPGWQTAVPFLLVIAVLLARGRRLPLRSFVLDRLPRVGTGRVRVGPALVCYCVALVVVTQVNQEWVGALTTTFAVAIICLSVVVITGYAGQVSLAQYILAGLGALVAAQLSLHLSFVVALVLAVLTTAVVGAVIGMPALRTRGVTLTIVTLGLASVIADVVLLNNDYTGGPSGITPPVPSLFGLDLDPFLHSSRYGIFALTCAALCALAVANLRRSATGRRILAVRSNERGAAALGVHVAAVKLYAFTLSAALAALGGVVMAFYQPNIAAGKFDVFTSIYIVAITVTGGIGYISGSWIGGTMLVGGVVSQIFAGWSSINSYIPLVGGIAVILMLRFAPDGQAEINQRALAPLLAHYDKFVEFLRAKVRRPARQVRFETEQNGRVHAADPQRLAVSDLTVRFGGVTALESVSLHIEPGEIHGLIGPNGAGKTTLIDAVTGFVQCQSGRVTLGEHDLSNSSVRHRASAGLSRSFQSLELFTDLTVTENIAVACDNSPVWRRLADLITPAKITLTAAAEAAMREFDLFRIADKAPGEISFGQRKAVAIARAVAPNPAVLLLDEPAAGLDGEGVEELSRLIRHIARTWGIGVLLVEHKVEMITAVSDRLTVLQEGRILTSGKPAEVVRDPRVIDAYLGGSENDLTASSIAPNLS